MSKLQPIMDELNENAIAKVTSIIDLLRLKYKINSNTVRDAAEFDWLLTDFLKYMYREGIAPGARMPDFEAGSRAKQILEHAGRRRGQTVMNYLANCIENHEGGARSVLDTLTDALKSEITEHYIEDVLDRHVTMDSWDERMAITEELMAQYGHMLPQARQ